MNVKIFADGADKAGMLEMNKNPLISGFTTNPTLMRKAGITDYKVFALDIIKEIPDKPLSFEVFADEVQEMYEQALEINDWGENVYVKIPVTNTKGQFLGTLISELNYQKVKVNVTAITAIGQVVDVIGALKGKTPGYISIFAGRIADTGVDPLPIMKSAVKWIKGTNIELIWASPREVFNVYQAEEIGCDIITCTNDIIKKLPLRGKDLTEYSLDTVKLFYNDAKAAGYEI